MEDALGDRMKSYEGREAGRRTMPGLPVVARLDGKGFSKWTKGLEYPFDSNMQKLREEVVSFLVRETNAVIGYCQSDEITLIWGGGLVYCEGRIQKMTSILASMATAQFNAKVPQYLPQKVGALAYFDARVWEMPSEMEAVNALLWRELDATKNSVSMAARSVYSHKEMHGKEGSELQQMLFEKGINWNDYPTWAKRGTYIGRRTFNRVLTPEELEDLPPLHNARRNPNMEVVRSKVMVLDMPPLSQVPNRVEVVFRGASPDSGKVT